MTAADTAQVRNTLRSADAQLSALQSAHPEAREAIVSARRHVRAAVAALVAAHADDTGDPA